MSNLVNFCFGNQDVRIVEQNGEPWFIAKDVCDILGIKNSRDAISQLEEDEKGVVSTDTLGGMQNMTAVSEAGLYILLFQSRKPTAKIFLRWVTHEVLPTIRKTGKYENLQIHEVKEEKKLPPSELYNEKWKIATEKFKDYHSRYVFHHHINGALGDLDVYYASAPEIYAANEKNFYDLISAITNIMMMLQ